MDYFTGKRAVITGAGAGIGQALALDLAARGARLTLWDRDREGLTRTAERCRLSGVTVHTQVVDVADRAAVGEAAAAVAERDGIELLFCVAGTIHTGTLQDSDLADFDHVMAVNFWGTVNTVKALLPRLVVSGGGHVVTVSSAFGLVAMPRYSAYCASKFAVRGFTERVTGAGYQRILPRIINRTSVADRVRLRGR
jgi:short-subunit dehydrogenase